MSVAFLSRGRVEALADKVGVVLSRRGVEVRHPGMLARLDQAGARVDHRTGIVRFPRDLQESALAALPRSLSLAAPGGRSGLALPAGDRGSHRGGSRDGGSGDERSRGGESRSVESTGGESGNGESRHDEFYLCTGTGARGWLDPETGRYRPLRKSDIRTWGILASRLDSVNLCAFPTPTDAPPETVDVHALQALLESCGKHVWIQPHTEASLPFLLELCLARAGGAQAFRRDPCASIIACAHTPFRIKSMDVEVMLQAASLGMPVHVSSLPVIGGTSPLSILGTVVVAAIEVVAMLIMAQVAFPGTPVVALATALGMDMANGRAVKACPEAMMANAASARFLSEAYGVPVHTAGLTTDAFTTDGQAMIEHSLYASSVIDAGAVIIGRAGELEAAKTFSPLQLVIDDEIVGALRRVNDLSRELEVGGDILAWEDALAWQDVMSVAAGGHFLETDHTLRHCREAFRPRLFRRQSREEWQAAGGPRLSERALERCRELLQGPREDALAEAPPGAREEMERLVREADRALSAEGSGPPRSSASAPGRGRSGPTEGS